MQKTYQIVSNAKPLFASQEEADKALKEFWENVKPELKKCDERRARSEMSPSNFIVRF